MLKFGSAGPFGTLSYGLSECLWLFSSLIPCAVWQRERTRRQSQLFLVINRSSTCRSLVLHLLRNSLLLPVLCCSRGFWRRSGAAGGGEEVALGSAASVPADHPCSDPDAVRASLPPWSVWLLCCSSCHSVMQSPRKC